jgi:hypothetical protein
MASFFSVAGHFPEGEHQRSLKRFRPRPHYECMKRFIALLLFTTAAAASPISIRYQQLGGPSGFLGAKASEETTAPDGVGSFQHFQNGSLFFHPECGTREVHGLIRDRYQALGWQTGFLGYPITDEIDLADGSGRVSKFKGGELIWRPSTNAVTEVRSTDLVVDLPFPVGEAWKIGQTNAVTSSDSHGGPWAYCWDINFAQGASANRPFVASATSRIVLVDEGFPSGKANGNPGNVVVQRFGEGRYGAYLHIAPASYKKQFVKGTSLFRPQDLGGSGRPLPASGTPLGEVGDTGTGVNNHHMHFCVTTAPDRGAYGPYESVPVAFRNYSVSTDQGTTWKFVATGVPRSGQWVRRESSTGSGAAKVSHTASVISHGKIVVTVKAGDGKPTGPGKLKITVISAWGEYLRQKTIDVPANNLSGPWTTTFTNVPAYKGERVVVSYAGPWSRAFDRVDAEGTAFDLAPDGTAAVTLSLKTTLIH